MTRIPVFLPNSMNISSIIWSDLSSKSEKNHTIHAKIYNSGKSYSARAANLCKTAWK